MGRLRYCQSKTVCFPSSLGSISLIPNTYCATPNKAESHAPQHGSQFCLVYQFLHASIPQFTPKFHEGILVINSLFKDPGISGHSAPSSQENQAAAVGSSSSYQCSRSKGWHEKGEVVMLPRESPGSFSCGCVPHEPHVKMEPLGGLKSYSNLTVAEMANCPLYYVTGKWMSSPGLHFPAALASWHGPVTHPYQWAGSESDLCHLRIMFVTSLIALRYTSLPFPYAAHSVQDWFLQTTVVQASFLGSG